MNLYRDPRTHLPSLTSMAGMSTCSSRAGPSPSPPSGFHGLLTFRRHGRAHRPRVSHSFPGVRAACAAMFASPPRRRGPDRRQCRPRNSPGERPEDGAGGRRRAARVRPGSRRKWGRPRPRGSCSRCGENSARGRAGRVRRGEAWQSEIAVPSGETHISVRVLRFKSSRRGEVRRRCVALRLR